MLAVVQGNLLQRNTVMGLCASVLLATGKFVAGVTGHSSALIADAMESLADTIGSIVVWHGLRVADRPPDEKHPYGYGKAEAIAALSVGGLLIVAAGIIVARAIREMMMPHSAPAPWTLAVLLGVIMVKETLFRLVLRGAEALESDAARADAWHHRADAITSVAAVIGVSVAIWGPQLLNAPRLVLADEAAAIVASGIIVFTAIGLMRPSIRELLDATTPELARQVAQVASAVEGVRLIEKVLARKSGSGYHIDMHVHVEPEMSVRDSHALAGKVKAVVRELCPRVRQVLIHIEPYSAATGDA